MLDLEGRVCYYVRSGAVRLQRKPHGKEDRWIMVIYEYKKAFYVVSDELNNNQQIWKKKEGTYKRDGVLPKVECSDDVNVGDLLSFSVAVRDEPVDPYGYNGIAPIVGYTRFAALVTAVSDTNDSGYYGPATRKVTMIVGSTSINLIVGDLHTTYFRPELRQLASAIDP